MQQIATSKSNLAALGVPSEKEVLPIPSRAEEFRQLLKDNDKQLGYASPVDPIGAAAESKGTKTQTAAVNEKHPVEQKSQESAETEMKQDQVSQSEQEATSDAQENFDGKSEQGAESTLNAENPSQSEVTEDAAEIPDEESVDWLSLLQRANESHDKIVISPVEDSKSESDLDGIVSKLDVSVRNVVSELSLEQIQQDPFANMLKEVSELPEIPETLAIDLKKLLPKLESSLGDSSREFNLDELDKQELETLQQALNQWLMHQSEQENQQQGESAPDLSLLMALMDKSETAKSDDPQLSMFDMTEEEMNKLLNEVVAKVDIPADMKALLTMPEQKLEKVLSKLAESLGLSKKDGEAQARLTGIESQADKAADSSASEVKSEFIASLKVGVEEIKSQIKQGHQPALDLKALVNETINKMTKGEQIAEVPVEKVDQVMASLTRTLDAAQLLSASQDSQAIQATTYDRVANREGASQVAVEQARQQPSTTANDKAINITRPEGHQQMADKVRWMVNSNNLQADIRLDPPELGSMQIRVNVSGEAASVSFVVQSQQARDVLEQATPRLKELLEEQGIELGQSSVQQESGEGANSGEGELAGNGQGQGDESEDAKPGIEQRVVNGSLSGIDYYV